MVKDTLNPFDNNLEKERLFNLGTGKAEMIHRGLSHL